MPFAHYQSAFLVSYVLHIFDDRLCFTDLVQRPFVNYYAPVFVLYELSTPFLNVHWFCDKLNMTGGKLQWCNGILLLLTFFCSRLVWGTYQSMRVFRDMWLMLHVDRPEPAAHIGRSNPVNATHVPLDRYSCLGKAESTMAQCEVMQFVDQASLGVPFWLALVSLMSIIILQSLNVYWLGRMIRTLRKRFDSLAPDEYKKDQ